MQNLDFKPVKQLYEMAEMPDNKAIIQNSITEIQNRKGSKNLLTCIEENTELIVELTHYLQGHLEPFHLAEEYVHCFFNIAYTINIFDMEPITDEERINYIKSIDDEDIKELFKNAQTGYLTTHVLTMIRELCMIGKAFSKHLRGKLMPNELRSILIAQDLMLICIRQSIPMNKEDIKFWMTSTLKKMSNPSNHR